MKIVFTMATLIMATLQVSAQIMINPNMLNLPNADSVIKLNFNAGGDSFAVNGIEIDAPVMTNKGARTGVLVDLETNSLTGQQGSSQGRLGSISAYFAGAGLLGVYGTSTPVKIHNFNDTTGSSALGGSFHGGPAGAPLSLDGSGTYWVGGVQGTLRGTINGKPGKGAVAAVIGIDSADPKSTSSHWAGYFVGDVNVGGKIYLKSGNVVADYVFGDDYKLESIEDHADYMWREQHLSGVTPQVTDASGEDLVEIGERSRGILEELEKAHIYIAQLNATIKQQAAAAREFQGEIGRLNQEVNDLKEMDARLAMLEKKLSH